MGHGASTSVKTVALVKEGDDHSDLRPVWTRSNSDGCIVENLNTSKTKVDLLELQVDESRELLRAAEGMQKKAEERANTLEKQLAEVEGTNFELTDRVSDLEQQLESIQANSGSEVNLQLEQELTFSNQQVEKLEMHIKLLEEQMATMRSKFRKKLRAAKTEVTEAKQESSLKLYSLKDQIKQMEEENLKLTERLSRAERGSGAAQAGQASGVMEDSRTVVILELSNQVSMQEETIADLREQLERRDRTIADLTAQLTQDTPRSRPVSQVSSRPPSGMTNRPSSGRSGQRTVPSDQRKGSGRSGGSRDGVSQSFEDILDSDDEERLSSNSRLTEMNDDGDRTGRSDSARSKGKGGQRDGDKDSTHSRRDSSSRERRHSGRKKERTRGDDTSNEPSTGRPKSSSHVDDPVEGGQRRKRSSSRGRKKETPSKDSESAVVSGTPSDLSASPISRDVNGNKSDKVFMRISSAGSHDSAFHETVEEGSKSAPSSAGSSRSRRRLKVAQQRAASLEVVNSNQSSPKPPSRTDVDLSERDSGVDDNCLKGSNRTTEASNHELDDLLQELLSDESPGEKSKASRDVKHNFGISEDKIRSLLSDNAK